MIEFHIQDMTCGGCAARIRRALEASVPGAAIELDVAARRVRIDAPGGMDADRLREVIAQAGYRAQPVAAAAPAATAIPARTGCGCTARRMAQADHIPRAKASGCCS